MLACSEELLTYPHRLDSLTVERNGGLAQFRGFRGGFDPLSSGHSPSWPTTGICSQTQRMPSVRRGTATSGWSGLEPAGAFACSGELVFEKHSERLLGVLVD